jgi:perosamine synthetase
MNTREPAAAMRYRATEPLISPKVMENLGQVMAERYLSPGHWVGRFERAWAEACGVRYAVAASSGTAALHLAMLATGIGPGDEVIVPAMTCPDTLNAVMFAGAVPVIVDIERVRFGIDPVRVRQAVTSRTKAVMPVHLYGAVVDPEVFQFCRDRELMLVEDAAEAHGSELDGRRAGSLGLAGCFSFRGDKMLGVGTGGMITTDDEGLAGRARHLIGLAGPGGFDRYLSSQLAYSYEMSNVHAAIGVAQLEMLEPTIAAKRRIAAWYDVLLSDELVDKPALVEGHVFWRYSVLLKRGDPRRVYARLAEQGIETMPPFVPAYRLTHYAAPQNPDNYPVAEDVYRRLLSLPISPYLERHQVEEIVAVFHDAVAAETA